MKNVMIKEKFIKFFNIPADELKKTLLLQLNIFLILTTLLIIKPTINSIFISELSADALPIAYILTALSAVLGSLIYNRSLERYALNKIIRRNLIISIICLIVFGLCLAYYDKNLGNFLYIPYVWVGIFGLLTTSQFWVLSNVVYKPRKAKRVFGFIGAGAIIGGIFGGYLASVLSGFMPSEYLLFVAAFLLFWCIPITHYIWKSEMKDKNQYQVNQRKEAHKGETPLQLIKNTPLLKYMAITAGIGVVVSKLVDYQYNLIASENIDTAEKLTAFFGFWLSTISAISLFIQLFLTSRIIKILGVGNSLLIMPIGILFGAILLLIFPELWVVVLMKVIDGGLKQSVNKTATELLSIPIPIEIKKKTKTFIDVVVDSLATGFAGLILSFFILGLDLPYEYVTILTIALISTWIFFITKLKRAYLLEFRKLVNLPVAPKKTKKVKKPKELATIKNSVEGVLEHGSEPQILYMLGRILEEPNERFFNAIKNLLNHPSDAVKILALQNLYFLKGKNLTKEIEPMATDENPEIVLHSLRYIIEKNRPHPKPEKRFEPYLESTKAHIKNSVLVCLSQEIEDPKERARYQYKERFQSILNNWQTNEVGYGSASPLLFTLLETIGNSEDKDHFYLISEALESSNAEVRKMAITNASKLKSPLFIDALIANLAPRDTRETAVEALHNYGEAVIDELALRCKNGTVGLTSAQFIPMVIESFASSKAVKTLIDLIDTTEYAISTQAVDSLKRLKWGPDQVKIRERFIIDKILDECQVYQDTLAALHVQIVVNVRKKTKEEESRDEMEARAGLMDVLEQHLDRRLERIFSVLGVKYPPNEIDPLYDALRCDDQERRENAMEILDTILEIQLKRELLPITEAAILHGPESEEVIKKLNLKTYSESQCYEVLLKRPDIRVKHAVLYVMEKTGDPKFLPLVALVANDPWESVRLQATSTREFFGLERSYTSLKNP